MRLSRPTLNEIGFAIAGAVAAFITLRSLLGEGHWPIRIAIVLAIVVALVWPARSADADDTCVKCAHTYEHHHGPCQACLRAEAAGTTDRVPCGRFKAV